MLRRYRGEDQRNSETGRGVSRPDRKSGEAARGGESKSESIR